MKRDINKKEAVVRINEFFEKDNFDSEEIRKIKRLAMKYKIRLGMKRKLFCKKCYSKLEGKTRLNKKHKTIECINCGFKNKFKIS